MKKQEMKTNLFGIIVMAAMCIVGSWSCTSTSTDTKGKREDGALSEKRVSVTEDNQTFPSSASDKVETVTAKIPDAAWLNKDEPREKIWEYTPPSLNPDRQASPLARPTEYRFAEVEVSSSSLFLSVEHKLKKPVQELVAKQGMTESPTLEMFVDGCPQKSPRFAGIVEYNAKTPSMIVVPRVDLPIGDIELRVSAFGETHHIILLNYEDGLKVMTSRKQSRWYRHYPGDPKHGTESSFSMDYPKRPGCPVETIEEE